MRIDVGFMGLVVFAAYYFILKFILLLINIELRRNRIHVPAAVSGLLS